MVFSYQYHRNLHTRTPDASFSPNLGPVQNKLLQSWLSCLNCKAARILMLTVHKPRASHGSRGGPQCTGRRIPKIFEVFEAACSKLWVQVIRFGSQKLGKTRRAYQRDGQRRAHAFRDFRQFQVFWIFVAGFAGFEFRTSGAFWSTVIDDGYTGAT